MTAAKKRRRIALLSGVALAIVAWLNWEELSAWYLFWCDFESLGSNDQGYPEYRHRETRIVFVKLPGGTFLMGSPTGEAKRRENELQHKVTLSAFLIAKYEVSQAQWKRVMGSNPSRFRGENLPVENVSWDDCQKYCKKTGLSLPTEAQWEFTCRAGSQDEFCFGDDASRLGEYAWYRKNAGGRPHSVGERKPNAFGLHDMHGNVHEWCEDVYDREFYKKPEASRKNPVCASGRAMRVLRGGCWQLDAGSCRSSRRSCAVLSFRFSVGCRPSRSLEP